MHDLEYVCVRKIQVCGGGSYRCVYRVVDVCAGSQVCVCVGGGGGLQVCVRGCRCVRRVAGVCVG